MPTPPDFVYLTDDATKTPLAWDAFMALPDGTRVTVNTRGKDHPFVRKASPVRTVYLATDVARANPIDPATLSTLPPDTAIVVWNGTRGFESQAGTVFIPPTLTLAILAKWARVRDADGGNNKPSDPATF